MPGIDGKPNPVQLSLFDANPTETTIRIIRRWSGGLGLRVWAAFQRLLSVEGARTGEVTWTLAAQLDAMGIASKHRAEMGPDIAAIVEKLTQIQLAVVYKAKDGTERRRCRRPLLKVEEAEDVEVEDVEAGEERSKRWQLDSLRLSINSDLYSGVKDGRAQGRNWGNAPVEIARIDHAKYSSAIALGMIIPIRLRLYRNDHPGSAFVPISGQKLLEAADIAFVKRREAEAWRTLTVNLEVLQRAGGIERWEWEHGKPGLSSDCRLFEAQWSADRSLRGIKPDERPPAPEALAVTKGADLETWREARGLSQRQAADMIGMTRQAWSKAEAARARPVSARLRRALSDLPR